MQHNLGYSFEAAQHDRCRSASMPWRCKDAKSAHCGASRAAELHHCTLRVQCRGITGCGCQVHDTQSHARTRTCFLNTSSQNSLQMNLMASRSVPMRGRSHVYRSTSCRPTLKPAHVHRSHIREWCLQWWASLLCADSRLDPKRTHKQISSFRSRGRPNATRWALVALH